MTPETKDACDTSRLRRLLESELSAAEESALALHLDGCPACRHQLEELAASPGEWDRIRRLAGRAETGANPDSGYRTVQRPDRAEDRNSENPKHLLSFLGPTDDPAMLGRLGPYEVIGLVGEGGMGIVLKVFDRALNRNVAVKVLAPQLAAAGPARRRFAREAQAAAAVVHEHVIAIHAVAEFNGFPYLVMPYVPGPSLQQRIDSAGSLAVAEILRIGAQTAAGLAAAHAQGLVHRDIKPANILLENGVERVLITDFGLARAVDDATLTCSGIVAGTPMYMAPEQAQGGTIDHRADLFSLGSVLYAMCTGRPPFRADTAIAVLRRICEDRPRPIRELNPEIPAWLTDIIDRLLAKNPAERFQTAAEVAALLEQCLAHVQNPSAFPLPPGLASTPVRRLVRGWRRRTMSRLFTPVAALLLLFGIGAAGYWIREAQLSGAPGLTGPTGGDPQTSAEAAAADLEARGVDASKLRDSAQAADGGWADAPDEPQNRAPKMPRVIARIRRLDGEHPNRRFTITHVRRNQQESWE